MKQVLVVVGKGGSGVEENHERIGGNIEGNHVRVEIVEGLLWRVESSIAGSEESI